jgi:Ca2+-binding RTX toxin-like protein
MAFQKIVIPEPLRIKSDGTLEFTVSYESDDPTVSNLSLGLYFDSSVFELVNLPDIYYGSLFLPDPSFINDIDYLSRNDQLDWDQNPDTDQFFLAHWMDIGQTWPGTTNLDLYTIKFQVQNGVNLDDFSTVINFTGNGAIGFTLDLPTNVVISEVNQIPVIADQVFTLDENTANGKAIATVNMVDADDTIASLKVEIVGGSEAFEVKLIDNQWNLVVKNGNLLDFETTPEFNLNLKVTDPVGEFSQSTVTINLNDLNEEPPAQDDDLIGTGKNDTLDGGGGDDNIIGKGGNDLLKGGTGDDILIGGVGNDILNGGTGNDVMIGGIGNDIYIVDSQGDIIIERAKSGFDLVKSSINYTLGNNLENLTLTGIKNLTGTGNNLNNIMTGNGANNILRSEGGNDKLLGGNGNDTLVGGLGKDTLTGGTGADKFTFESKAQGVDTITDFKPIEDKIAIKASGFGGGLQAGVLSAEKFVSGGVGNVASTASVRFIYNSDGALYFDPDGNGSTAQTQIATFNNPPVLSNSNFVII